jgi:hypothetical protein
MGQIVAEIAIDATPAGPLHDANEFDKAMDAYERDPRLGTAAVAAISGMAFVPGLGAIKVVVRKGDEVVEAGVEVAEAVGRGSNNPKTRKAAEIGQEAHRQIEKQYRMRGYRTEVTLELEKSKRIVRKDAKKENEVVIVKPDTSSGRKSAGKRERLMQNEGYDTRIDLYDPAAPAWQPGSPSYIGPRPKGK